MKKIKSIVFDFDGVIKESVDIKTKAFAKLYSKFGEKVLNNVLKHHLEILKHVFFQTKPLSIV